MNNEHSDEHISRALHVLASTYQVKGSGPSVIAELRRVPTGRRRSPRAWAALALASTVAVVAALLVRGGGDEEVPVTSVDVDGGGAGRTGAVIAEYFANSTPEQKELVADGNLTRRDYEVATAAALDCMREAGLRVSDITTGTDPARIISYAVHVPPGASETAVDDCDARYAQDIRAAWLAINTERRPPTSGTIEQAGESLTTARDSDDTIAVAERVAWEVLADPAATTSTSGDELKVTVTMQTQSGTELLVTFERGSSAEPYLLASASTGGIEVAEDDGLLVTVGEAGILNVVGHDGALTLPGEVIVHGLTVHPGTTRVDAPESSWLRIELITADGRKVHRLAPRGAQSR